MSTSCNNSEYLSYMSRLLPIATNFLYNIGEMPSILDENTTLECLYTIFSNTDGYELWSTNPTKFVSMFMYVYWSTDTLGNTTVILENLKKLDFTVMQYIALSVSNLQNQFSNNDDAIIFDLNSIEFTHLYQLIQLFSYMLNLQKVDYSYVISKELGSNIYSNVKYTTNKNINENKNFINQEKSKQEKIKLDEQQNIISQKLSQVGINEIPNCDQTQMLSDLSTLEKNLVNMHMEELKLLTQFSTNLDNLINLYASQFENVSDNEEFFDYYYKYNSLRSQLQNDILNIYSDTNAQMSEANEIRKKFDALKKYIKIKFDTVYNKKSNA